MITVRPQQLTLGELIERLRGESSFAIVPEGIANPHSYRGYYDELAFEIKKNVTVGEMLDSAESAVNETFSGYKGGEFTMDSDTFVWIVRREGETGETLGAFMLELMLFGAV